jgi:hypothetical protein
VHNLDPTQFKYEQLRTSAHQHLTRHEARADPVRSSLDTYSAVPRGWPPPRIASRSGRPVDVSDAPKVHGFVPRRLSNADDEEVLWDDGADDGDSEDDDAGGSADP